MMATWHIRDVVIAIVICLAAIIYGVYAETWGQEPPAPPDDVPTVFFPQHEARLLTLEREAIDNAYRQQVQSLYFVWMKDPTGQPSRAHRGANQAKDAYVKAMEAIDRREKLGREMIKRPPTEYK